MADPDHGMHIAAGIKVSLQLHPHRVGCRHQVVKDAIGHLFMGDRAVSVAVDVELDCLELYHPWTGLIDQAQNSKVGVSRERALAGELGQLNRNLIGPSGPGVLESDQFSVSNGTLAVLGRLGLVVSH